MRLLRILTTGVQEVLASAARVVDKVRVVLTRSDGYIDESFLENAETWNIVAGDYVTRTTEQTVTGEKTFTEPVTVEHSVTGRNINVLPFSPTANAHLWFRKQDNSQQGLLYWDRGGDQMILRSYKDGSFSGVQTILAQDAVRWNVPGLSNGMHLTATGLGIGTTSPGTRLHVDGQAWAHYYRAIGNLTPTGSRLSWGWSQDNNYGWIQTFGGGALALNPLGNNVGIGTANPEDALTVAGTGSFTGGVKQDLPGRYLMFRNPVGRVTNQASRTGVIVLRMPNTDNAFVNARIVIQRNYHHPIIVEAGGYFRAANENWINTWVRVTQSTGSRTVKKVYFTVDSDFRACIILDSDNAASPWLSDWNSYPSLTVDQLYIGWTAADGDTDWKQVGNYSIYWEDTEAGFNTLTDKFSAERTSASENWHDVWDSNNLPDPARLSGSESFSKGHGKSISDFNAVNGSDDAWNQPSNATLRLKEVNNALAVLVSGESNDRKALIQMGHDSPNFASASFGNALCLQPFSGRVGVGTASPQHKFHVDGVAAAPTIRHLSTDPAWYFQWTTQTIQLPGGGITDSFLQLSNRTGEAIAQFYEGAGTAVFFDGVFANGFFSNNSSWNVQLGVNNGRMRCSGAGNGMIVTSPDGNTTKLIGIDNSGNIEVRDP